MADRSPADGEVTVEVQERVMVVTINRPAVRNAITLSVAEAIAAALDQLDAADELSAGVLTGAGGTFCAGRDLKASQQGDHPWVGHRGFAGVAEYGSVKPLIAAGEGYALGGGFEIVLSCDLVVAASSAKLGLPEVHRGRIAGAGGLIRLPDRVPYHIAMEMALTGEPVTADRAAHFGLVNQVVPDGQALGAAIELGRRVARNGPLAVTATKQVIRDSRDWPTSEAFARQELISAAMRASADARESARAFTEKRQPVWRNR
jgi:enoyl-CoA hydratase